MTTTLLNTSEMDPTTQSTTGNMETPHRSNTTESPDTSLRDNRAEAMLLRAGKLGAYLRNAGSIMLILSALAFMLQKWGIIDHVSRYFSFLGFTGMMALAALLCGLGVKEGKGARTLFGLVVALLPVHFAQLGGLLFSVFGDVPNTLAYPTYLLWQAGSGYAALSTLAIGVLCLTPILYLSFATLDRHVAGRLTTASIVVNAILLLPCRDPNSIALLAGASLLGTLYYTKNLKSVTPYATRESAFARLTLFLPVGVLVARQMTLYSLSFGFLAINLLPLAGILFFLAPSYVSSRIGGSLQVLSAAPLIFGCASALVSLGFGLRTDEIWVFALVVGLSTSLPLFCMSILSKSASRGLLLLSSLMGLGTTLLAFKMNPGVVSSGSLLVMVMTFITLAVLLERKMLLAISATSAVLAALFHVQIVLESFEFNLWITLGSVGLVTVVAASVLERYFSYIVQQIGALRASVATWQH